MKTAKVTVLPYNAAWAEAFKQIEAEVKTALGPLAMAVEHVGSTAVEGLSAKPCIDIDVVIKDEAALGAAINALASIGYLHEGDLGIAGREAFAYTGKAHLYKHHLYVCPQNSPELHRHITFRDFLKTHPEAVREYSAVKEKAAQLFAQDIDGYMAYKAPCIAKLYRQCGLE